MRNQGVNIGPYGLPCKLTLLEGNGHVLLRPPQAARHLHAAYNRQASRGALVQLLSAIPVREQARLRSCGGKSAGSLFTMQNLSADAVTAFCDESYTRAVRWRLGVQQFVGPPSSLCSAGCWYRYRRSRW